MGFDAGTGADSGQLPRPPHPWRRFVALGDSFTEGLDDPEPRNPGGYRGWADRAAEELSVGVPEFSYANLAVRGLLLHEVVETQMGPALALKPDLVSVQAGGNDLLHPGADPDKLAGILEEAVVRLRLQDITVVVFVGPDAGRSTIMGQFRSKIAVFNENMRSIAEHHDAVVADLWAMTELHDRRMWGPDRLHPSPLGHHAIAAMFLETLNVPHSLLPLAPKELPGRSWRQARVGDLVWARDYFMPWVLRGIRRESPTGGFGPKRPVASPVPLPASGQAPASDGQAPAPDSGAPGEATGG
ncbi:lysophospholipase L1-like esterase [Arthrobacter stackebrandtii]|uniref:Lysophospholipase L1-like esterase n=1 Tax=Arthrobacter stackebrandtii TaxID=272161 RepID=A0ABS4YS47_9MICC|nr:SGNH/GDSL hydrolase family protein [Arthrobacter stackebrandtii]MBP2411589.1 lysophospholipase L1-like esterase [Arthrobacter stackebrandtii]PYG99266.1 SGNH hydrolase [Arthrobacter stackebrandtii]